LVATGVIFYIAENWIYPGWRGLDQRATAIPAARRENPEHPLCQGTPFTFASAAKQCRRAAGVERDLAASICTQLTPAEYQQFASRDVSAAIRNLLRPAQQTGAGEVNTGIERALPKKRKT